MQQSDVAAVVDIHVRGYPGFFLTFLGPAFLTQLYEGILEDSDGVGVVAEEESGRLVGFAVGTLNQSGFYRRLLDRRKWRFAWAAAGAVLRRPKIAKRLLRALRRPAEAEQAATQACFMAMAVEPSISGKGIGRALTDAFNRALGARGARSASLTTDRDGNDRVNELYRRLGFRLHRSFQTPEGRWMNEYVWDIPA